VDIALFAFWMQLFGYIAQTCAQLERGHLRGTQAELEQTRTILVDLRENRKMLEEDILNKNITLEMEQVCHCRLDSGGHSEVYLPSSFRGTLKRSCSPLGARLKSLLGCVAAAGAEMFENGERRCAQKQLQ